MSGTKRLPSAEFDLDLALTGLAMQDNTHEMERMIKCLGEQIKATKESMQKEWQVFTEETQLSLEADVASIRNFSQYFQENIVLESHSCNTEAINVNVFLNNVVQALERNTGQEEHILDELTNFASHQGFVLPAPCPETNADDTRRSTASLNVVFSEKEETTSVLWERIRKMIGRGLLAAVDKLGLVQVGQEADTLIAGKVKLLEKMCMLYLPSDVWKKYLGLRSQQVERYLQNPANLDGFDAPLAKTDEENIPGGAVRLVRVSQALDTMLREDYRIIELGMFPEAFQIQREEVVKVYLSAFKNELRDAVMCLHTMGRRDSVKLGDCAGNTLSTNILLAIRQCVSAAHSVDASAKKFLCSLQVFYDKKDTLDSNFGSTFSISSVPLESVNSVEEVVPSPDEVVRDEPEGSAEDEIWCWQEEFKPVVSKLALAISEGIQSEARSALEKEMAEYEKNHEYKAVKVSDEMLNHALDYPKQVSKSCSVILGKADELVPFLLLTPGKEFEAVRNSFSESFTTVLMAFQSRLTQISSDVPRSSPVKNLYLAFNSAVFVQHTLKRYEDDYGEMNRSLSGVYCDLVESLHEKIISYHYATIATVILQDVQSHHWMNSKEFYEGERCSFSVQMWNYCMQGLRHDLWEMCPPVRAQTVFTSVLQYSLSCLVRRYSKVIPSYKRTKLFRSDITSLLFSVSSSMLFAISSSSTDIFNPDPIRTTIADIHNSCSALLAIMTVVSCPLETLCLFSSGGTEELISNGKATNTSWLSWLQPELYGEHSKSLLSLSDIQVVNIYFKLMTSQPRPLRALVLQTVLMRNAYLAVTIVTYLESYQIHFHREEESNPASTKKKSVQFRSQCLVITDAQRQDYCSDIVGSLYYVILKCCKRSKPLVNFIVALINRENSWQIFTSTEGLRLGEEDKVPVWLDCMYSTFKPYMGRLTYLVLTKLQKQPVAKSFKFTSMSSLLCGCQVNKPTPMGKQKDKTTMLFEAFEQVLVTLTSNLRLLPRVLFKIFNRIQDDLRQLKLTSDETPSAGVKLLGSMLYRCFSSIGVDDVPHGLSCSDDIGKDMTQLAQLIYHVMLGDSEEFFDNGGLPVALETMVKQKKVWVADQVRRISGIIVEMNEEELIAESGQDHFLELQYGLRAKHLFLDSKGKKALKQVYDFCQAKKDWVLRRIPLVSHLGSLLPPSPAKSRGEALSASFNPLHAYSSLGDYPFDHDAIECFPFDWEKLFQSNIGMSLKSFKRLVFNRYELQNEKDVEENKKELVEKLKAFYDQDSDAV